MLCGWGVKAGLVRVQIKLHTRAISERFRDDAFCNKALYKLTLLNLTLKGKIVLNTSCRNVKDANSVLTMNEFIDFASAANAAQ